MTIAQTLPDLEADSAPASDEPFRGPGRPLWSRGPGQRAVTQCPLGVLLSPGTSDKSSLELITLTCTCVAATLFWLLLTLFIRKLKRVRTFQGKFYAPFLFLVFWAFFLFRASPKAHGG